MPNLDRDNLLQIRGSRVRVVDYGGGIDGFEGTIALTDPGYDSEVGVMFDHRNRGFHDLNGACEHGYGYWIPLANVEFLSTNNNMSRRMCSCCKQVLPKNALIKAKSGRYVCFSCNRTLGYSTRNNTNSHKAKNHNKTYGFEFECIPRSTEDRAAILSYGYGFLPTSDGSLADGGVEFKSPIYHSLNGLRPMLRTISKHADLTHRSCGQHINIGDKEYIDSNEMEFLSDYANKVFDPLYFYMKDRRSDVERVVGRYFTGYADRECYTNHSSWINLSHNNRIEFRLSKFKNANQYFQVVCMWTEMLDCVINNFLLKTKVNGRTNMPFNCKCAEQTAAKLIKIFDKYAQDKATCQRPERNSYTATGTKRVRAARTA